MRSARAICCAAAMALCVAPSLRADEFDKLTYLTFSGPVQVPGAVLPAGTYTFKLADPNSGRRVIQIWDKDRRLITTLLTIPDQMMEAKGEPVVLFSERPANEPQAVKAWFYPSERAGYEFVYPKDQAMKIARANHSPVLAQSDTPAADADVATRSAATIGRVDEKGEFAETARASQSSANRRDASAESPSVSSAASDRSRSAGTSGRLPNTASPLPLVGLIAALSFIGALSVRRFRKRATTRL